MVKHIQTIRQQIVDELFESVWPFLGLARKGLKMTGQFEVKFVGMSETTTQIFSSK